MSTSQIDTSKVNSSVGIKIGNEQAQNVLIEFVNLRCPYCKQWWEEKLDLISHEVSIDNLHYVIKLFNKTSPSLMLGNVMHQYVPTDDSAIEIITKIYATQSEWGNLDSVKEVETFAESTLGLKKQDNTTMLQNIVKETIDANIRFVPTLIVDDIDFDQKISNDDFISLFKH
ncbi:thioredoxin domain-containing protein [Vagococcus sp. JNUCC 83]